MIELGKRQDLTIVKKVEFGVYLSDQDDKTKAGNNRNVEKVLLPAKEVPADAKPGDILSVYIYRDSEDRFIATTRETSLEVGKLALLRVKEVGKIGAFLEWELEKDLLLPFKEQTTRVNPHDECLVALYVDKSGRLCTTMKIYSYLETDSPYQKDDKVEGLVYEISGRFGAFVAVDNRYSGLIPAKEPAKGIRVGDRIQARVAGVLEDGKLTLSLREKAYIQSGRDAEKILQMLEEGEGYLPFNDRAEPELIREKTGMSKNEFKRAVGNLYKQRLIVIEPEGIRRV